jgi:hypothetical protein
MPRLKTELYSLSAIQAINADSRKRLYSSVFDGNLSDTEDQAVASGYVHPNLISTCLLMKVYSRNRHRKRAPEPVFDEGGRVTAKKIKKIGRQVEKAVSVAKVNCGEPQFLPNLLLWSHFNYSVDFPEFNFHLAATKYIRPKPPTAITTWEDDVQKSGRSTDKIMLIFYLPKLTPSTTVVSLSTVTPKFY